MRRATVSAALLGLSLTGCWGPRFARKSELLLLPASSPELATVIFLRPSREALGIRYTLAGERGDFLGELTAGSWCAVQLSPGAHLVVAWDDSNTNAGGSFGSLNEAIFNGGNPYVAGVHGSLLAGKLYFVEVSVGFSGPKMRVLTPRDEDWGRLRAWLMLKTELLPKTAEGQAYLDGERAALGRELRRAAELAATPVSSAQLLSAEGIDAVP